MAWWVYAMAAAVLTVLSMLEVENDPVILDKKLVLNENKMDVFRFMADLRNYPQWYPGLTAFDPVDAKAIGMGKHYTESITLPWIGDWSYDNTVSSYKAGEHIAFTSDSRMRFVTTMSVKQDGSQTILKYQLTSKHRCYLFQVLVPVMKLVYSQRTAQGLVALRYFVAKQP